MKQKAIYIYSILLRIPIMNYIARGFVKVYKSLFVENRIRLYARQQSLENSVVNLKTDIEILTRLVAEQQIVIQSLKKK